MKGISVLFNQFRFDFFLKYLFLKLLRKIFSSFYVESYTTLGEDKILEQFININSPGFFVDVGSNDPVKFSNTFKLYKAGWKGINIDGNEALIRKARKIRPNDISIHAYVSDTIQETVFIKFLNNTVSTLQEDHAEYWEERSEIEERVKVKTVTLQELLEQSNAPSEFELLSIDVEGHDLKVLKSIDLSRYSPQLIIIEMINFNFSDPGSEPLVAYLTKHKYELRAFNGLNAFFNKVK